MRKSIGIVLALATLTACSPKESIEDPYLWLEEVEGEAALAWVEEHNAA